MPSLKDLKNRIGSVKSTQKITSAMKMVAAAKLRKALRSLAAATIFIADVIFCVDLTEPILFLRSFKEGINLILTYSNYLSKILY